MCGHVISYVALHVSLIALPKKHDEREHGKDTIVPCARHLEVKSFSVRHHLLPKLRVRYAPRASQFSSPSLVRLALRAVPTARARGMNGDEFPRHNLGVSSRACRVHVMEYFWRCRATPQCMVCLLPCRRIARGKTRTPRRLNLCHARDNLKGMGDAASP